METMLQLDYEQLFLELQAGFEDARDQQNYPLMLFFYYQLLRLYGHLDISGNIHLYGAIAANRLNYLELAAYGFFLAAASGSVDSTERLIRGSRNILEELNAADELQQLSDFFASV
jgi:hypothetical protein